MTDSVEMQAEIERLREENKALKQGNAQGAAKALSMKVSEKGGLSVYGLGRFPVTLYKEQWLKLLDMTDQIREFIESHKDRLKSRD